MAISPTPTSGDAFDQALASADELAGQRPRGQRRQGVNLAAISASGQAQAGAGQVAEGRASPRDAAYSNATPGGRLANVGRVIGGLFTGAARATGQAAGSLADFGTDVVEGVTGQNPSNNAVLASTLAGMAYYGQNPHDPEGRPTFANMASMRSTLGTLGDDQSNQMSTEILSLAVGYGAGSAAVLSTRLGQTGKAAVEAISNPALRAAVIGGAAALGGAATDFVMVNPEQERFGNFLQSLGVDNSFVDWLAHEDGEGVFEGRFKNAVEGTLTGAAVESLMRVARFWRATIRGNAEEASAIQSEIASTLPPRDSIPEVEIRERQPGAEPTSARPESDIPDGEVIVNWGEAEDGTLFPEYGPPLPDEDEIDSLADLIRQTPVEPGAAERRVDMRQEPDVPPDAEVTARPEDLPPGQMDDGTVVFERADTGQAVGSIDRRGLRQFAEDVQMFRATTEAVGDEAADITRGLTPDVESRVGEMRIGPLGDVDSVPAFLRALMERVPAQEARSDDTLMRAVAAASGEVGEDPAALLEAGRLIAGKLADADTAMGVIRTAWVRMAKDIDELNIPGRDWEAVDDATFQQAAQAIHNMTIMSSYVQAAKQGLGRGLRVNQLPDADSYLRTLAKKNGEVTPPAGRGISPLPRTRAELRDWMDIWQNYKGDPVRRAAFLQGLITIPKAGRYFRQSIANFFTASILSAPRTLLLNLVGPGVISTVRTVERLSGAATASLNPFLSSAQRAEARAVARATLPAYFQTLKYTSDAFYQAWQAAKQNHTIIGGGGQIDAQAAFGPFSRNLISAAGQKPSLLYDLGNLINVWPSAVARLNNGMDEFAKRMAYQNEVIVRAMVSGAEQGLEGPALKAHMDDAVRNSFDAVGQAVDQDLLDAAERTTFTKAVGEPGGLVRQGANWINAVRRDIPETRFLLPVFNVPANALGETLRRLPIAAVPGLNRALGFNRTAAELAGDFGAVAQADAHGRALLGSAFLMSGIMLTRAGIITGAGPQEPGDRRVWLQTHQPYSIRIGDRWVRYDRYDILGGLLSIPATVADASINRRMDRGIYDLSMAGVGALAQWFRDRAALRSAAGLLSLGEDPTNSAESVFRQLGGSVAQGFIPNAIQAPITQAIDPYQRMRRDWTDFITSAIPGLSATLPPVRNVMGEPVQRASDTVFEGMFPVTMAPITSYEQDPVLDEMDRLYQVTGYGAGTDARNIGYGFFNPMDVQLENGKSLYETAMAARMEVRVDGQTLREALRSLFDSREYNEGVDADAVQRRTSLGQLSRGYMVRATLQRYNEAIRAEIVQGSPIARAYITAAAAKQRDDAYLRDIPVEDLVRNPDLYRTRGINNGAYSEQLQQGATGQLLSAFRGGN